MPPNTNAPPELANCTTAELRPASVELSMISELLNEIVTTQVHDLARRTATVTTGVIALNNRRPGVSVAEITAYLPDDTSPLLTLKKLLLEADWRFDDLIFLSKFLSVLSHGCVLLEVFRQECASLGEDGALLRYGAHLSNAWREICGAAHLAIEELDAELGLALPEIYIQSSRVLCALLAGAQNGLQPCINGAGELYLPPLPQKRRWPRRGMTEACVITYGDKKYSAYTRDVSASGIGLEHAPSMAEGRNVCIELKSGLKIEGTVVWSIGDLAGVAFKSELELDDPLLTG